MTFFCRVVKEEKMNYVKKISHKLNSEIIPTVNVKLTTLNNLGKKNIVPTLQKSHPYTTLPPPFYNLLDTPPLRETKKIHSSHLKKRGPHYGGI